MKPKRRSRSEWWLEFAFWFFLVAAFFNLSLLPFLSLASMIGATMTSLLFVIVFFYLSIWKSEENKKKKSFKFWISILLILIIAGLYMLGIMLSLAYQFVPYSGNNIVTDPTEVFNSTYVTNGSVLYGNGYYFTPPAGYHYLKNVVFKPFSPSVKMSRYDYILGSDDNMLIVMVSSFPLHMYGGTCAETQKNAVISFKVGMEEGVKLSENEYGAGNYSVKLTSLNYTNPYYYSAAYESEMAINGTYFSVGAFVFFCDDKKDLGVIFVAIGPPTERTVTDFYSMLDSFRFND